MKLALLFSLMAIAAFAQEPRHSIAAGVDNGVFATLGIGLSQNTSTYTNVHVTGGGLVLSQGLSFTLLRANEFRMAVAADAGVTSRAQFALSAGVMPSFDISKWTRVSGLSVIGRVQMQRVGSYYSPNLGVGLSKSF